jgi:uncharacterized repeat protein (TIGR01451 family)
MNDNCCFTNGLPVPAVAGPALTTTAHNPCEMATPVFVCNTPVTTPVSVIGEDCTGAPVTVTDPHVVLTVPAPGAVQLVKFCNPTGEFDREYSTLCAPDGTKVLVVTAWDKTAPLATAPAIEAYTLAGTPYAGNKALLVDCAAEKLDVVNEEYCSGGKQYERTSFYDVTTTPPTLAATLWRDDTGAAVTAPAVGVVGTCKAAVYVERSICANTNAGEVWDMIERVSTDSAGITTVSYWDPDTSPKANVTALYNSIRHGGACDCCNDTLPPKRADLSLIKTASKMQVFAGDTLTYTIVITNNGPDSADGATVQDVQPAGFTLTSTNTTTTGGAAVSGSAPLFTVGTFPAGATVTVTLTGTVTGAGISNTAKVIAPAGVDYPSTNNESTVSPELCIWEDYHENFSPLSTLMGVYSTGSGVNTLGFVNVLTGALTAVGTIPGANLNALGLDKSTNNAVFIDRNTGNIYTAYSPNYAITNPSVLQPGPVVANSTILGALDSHQQWWAGNISGSTGSVATINVAIIDPQTGIQTAVPGLTATLASGASGFDFDFAPNDDLYALIGLNIYRATKSSGYAGWTSVGTLTGIAATGGSAGYDQGTIRGTSSTGQVWAFNIATGVTTITTTMPAGTIMADMAGAVDPVCKRVFRNSCTGVFYELNKTTVYTPVTTPVAGVCV